MFVFVKMVVSRSVEMLIAWKRWIAGDCQEMRKHHKMTDDRFQKMA